MRTVVITGVAGFIGSTLAERLLQDAEVRVRGVDCFTDYYSSSVKRDNLAGLMSAPRFELVDVDLATADLGDVLAGAQVVFHQAGQPGVRPSWGDSFRTYLRDNVQATQRLLEAARLCPTLERVVYASSSSVYGDATRYPTTELDLPQPVSPYGVTKLAAEHLMSLYAANFGLSTVSLRYFTVYGPRQRPDMGFTRFLTWALDERAIRVHGDGEQIRDFTFVDDIVEANVAAGRADLAPGTVLNVSGGASVSLNQVFGTLAEVTGADLELVRGEPVPGDVRQTGGDAARAAALLGWAPRVSLAEGLSRQLDWLRPRLPVFRELL